MTGKIREIAIRHPRELILGSISPTISFDTMSLTQKFLHTARLQEIAELQALERTCKLVRSTGELIHRLQAERGAANAYLAGPDTAFQGGWQEKCAAADTAIGDLHHLLNDTITGSSRLFARIALATHELGGLEDHRKQVDTLDVSTLQSAAHYTLIINELIALIFEAIDTTVDPTVSRILLALFNLIEGKEYAGLERANGVRMLSNGHAEAQDQQLLAGLIDRQERSLSRFEAFCGDDVRTQWSALQSTLPLRELERLRRQLLSPNLALARELIAAWLEICSTRIDAFHQVECYLADLLQASCHERIAETQALLEEEQCSLKLPDNRTGGVASAVGEPADHAQALSSRLNRTLMDLLLRQSNDLQTMSAELSSVRAALEDRKLIERAKGMLMAQKGISEGPAYALLRQKAMSQNIRIGEVAAALLSMADFFPTRKS